MNQVTVTLTVEQLLALQDFANKGTEEWLYDRDNCQEVFTEEEIEGRNELMNQCDQASLIISQTIMEREMCE